jgi:hypothetical protein
VYRGRSDEVQRALDAESNRLVVFDGGVVTLDREGRVVAVTGSLGSLIGADFSTLPVFAEVALNHEPGFSDVDSQLVPGVMTAALAVPVIGPDREFGGVVLGMFRLGATSFSSFYGGLIKLRIGEGAATYLVDGAGKIIYHNTPALIGQLVQNPSILDQIRGHELEAWRTQSAAGGEVLASIAPVPGTPWTLVKEEDWSALLAASGTYGRALAVCWRWACSSRLAVYRRAPTDPAIPSDRRPREVARNPGGRSPPIA